MTNSRNCTCQQSSRCVTVQDQDLPLALFLLFLFLLCKNLIWLCFVVRSKVTLELISMFLMPQDGSTDVLFSRIFEHTLQMTMSTCQQGELLVDDSCFLPQATFDVTCVIDEVEWQWSVCQQELRSLAFCNGSLPSVDADTDTSCSKTQLKQSTIWLLGTYPVIDNYQLPIVTKAKLSHTTLSRTCATYMVFEDVLSEEGASSFANESSSSSAQGGS